MNIRGRIFVFLVIIFACSLVGGGGILYAVVIPAFERVEQSDASRNVKRLQYAFDAELIDLTHLAGDWAQWDETYSFANTHSQTYIDEQEPATLLTNFGLDFAAFYDLKGTPIWVSAGTSIADFLSADPASPDRIALNSLLISPSRNTGSQGLLTLHGIHYFAAFSPILDSKGEAMPRGTVIFGRQINSKYLRSIESRTEVAFRIRVHVPAAGTGVAHSGMTGDTVEVDRTSATLTHRFTLYDLADEPALDVDVFTPRDATAIGRRAVEMAGLMLVVVSIVVMIFVAVVISILIIRPITRINSAMRAIADSGRIDQRLAWVRKDEFGQLAYEFDYMLGQIAGARQKALEAAQAKAAFLSNMSHELRTPLNAIIGFSEILAHPSIGPKDVSRRIGYAADIHASAHHLLELINDVLDYSKIEAGRMDLSEVPTEIDAMIHFCFRLLSVKAEEKSIALVHNSGEACHSILCDERRIKQVLLNLLSNAIKFTRPGGTVAVRVDKNTAGDFVIQVRDTGIGMTKEQAAKVLEPFAQIEDPQAQFEQGTGLGLPISKALVELHGGDLAIESEPGIGTVVTIRLPASRLVVATTN